MTFAERLRVPGEITEWQTIDLAKIHKECLAVVRGVVRRGKEMQALHSPFPHLFPLPLLFEMWVYFLKAADRVDRTECHKPHLEIGKVAALRNDDEVRLIEFGRCSFRRVKIERENRHPTARK